MFSFAQMGGLCNGGLRGAGHGAQRQAPLRGECGGVFVWGLPSDARMGTVSVVVIRCPAVDCIAINERGVRRPAWHGHGPATGAGFRSAIRPLPGRRLQSNLPRGAQPTVEAFDEGVSRAGFPGAIQCQLTLSLSAMAWIAFEMNSVPLLGKTIPRIIF